MQNKDPRDMVGKNPTGGTTRSSAGRRRRAAKRALWVDTRTQEART